MRNVNYTQALGSYRTIKARLTFRDTLLRFAAFQAPETVSIVSEDSDVYNNGLLRVVAAASSGTISFGYYASATSNFQNGVLTATAMAIKSGSGIGLYQNRLFYQNSSGTIYYADFNGSTFGSPVSTGITYTDVATICPVSTTAFYLVVRKWSGGTVIDLGDLEKYPNVYAMTEVHYYTYSTVWTDAAWSGQIYDQAQEVSAIDGQINIADAVHVGTDEDYLYLVDNTNKRSVYLHRNGSNWSELKPVLPIDVVDDQSYFIMSSVNLFSGKVFITGVLKRAYGTAMHVYMIGPEEFTVGRELFIRPENVTKRGKLHLFDSYLWYVGDSLRFKATPTTTVGVDTASLKTVVEDINSLTINTTANSPFTLSTDLRNDVTGAALKAGAEVTVEAAVNNEYSQLGVFGIDTLPRTEEIANKSLKPAGRSIALKRLSQWESDASYDYWSQTKMNTLLSDYNEMVVTSGDWDPVTLDNENIGLFLNTRNEDGILYCTANAASNGIMRTYFSKVDGSYDYRIGVGVNYYLESRYDASIRLGIDMEDVEDEQCGSNGIFAIWGDKEHNNTPGIALYLMRDSNLVKITSAAQTLTDSVIYALEIRFSDGVADVYIRQADQSTWTNKISYLFKSYQSLPWMNEGRGRGAIYCRNITPHTEVFGFGSDTDYLPVKSLTGFTWSDQVIVDEEKMTYTGKSTNTTLIEGLKYSLGRLLIQNTNTGNREHKFGYDRTNYQFVQGFPVRPYVNGAFTSEQSIYLNAVQVYLKRIGNPEDAFRLAVYAELNTDDPDAWRRKPLGNFICSADVPSEDISESYKWITVMFHGEEINVDHRTTGTTTGKKWLVFTRSGDTGHPDKENYYATKKTTTGKFKTTGTPWFDTIPGDHGKTWTFNEDSDHMNLIDDVASPGLATDPPFKVYDNVVEVGTAYVIHIQTTAALSQTANYYKNCALVVTEGSGAGNTYKIKKYVYDATSSIFYVDHATRDVLDETSVFAIAPCLLGLNRTNIPEGGGDPVNTGVSHSTGAICHIYRTLPFTQAYYGEFFSSEEDLTLEEMAEKIARKAGILSTTGKNLYPSMIQPSTNSLVINRKNFTVKATLPQSYTGTFVVSGRRLGETDPGINLEIDPSTLKLNFYTYGDLAESFPLEALPAGNIKVTYFDDFVSFWCNGKFIHTFTINPMKATPFYVDYAGGTYFTITGTMTETIAVYVPEASLRIDNYILDAGMKGLDLLDSLINQKRFWYQDTNTGGLRIFQYRDVVNAEASPYTLAVVGDKVETDGNLITRLRLEGTDIKEEFDTDLMVNYGNLFHMSNLNEIISAADADYYTGALLEDYGSRVGSRNFTGAADPRIEPGDLIYVNLSGEVKQVIVDTLTYNLGISENNVQYDMNINGRIPKTPRAE